MNKKEIIQKISEQIIVSKEFLLTIHEAPDGDAVGSMLALAGILELMNKKVYLFSTDPVPIKHRFLKGWEKVINNPDSLKDKKIDVLIMLDCGSKDRAGDFITDFKSYQTLINIDHHDSNNFYGNINLVDSVSCCTGEEVYELIKELMLKQNIKTLPSDIASCLLTALYEDTGGMRYTSTTSKALGIAAELVEYGASCSHVSEQIFFNISKQRMLLLGRVLSTLNFDSDGKIAYTIMTLKDLSETGAYSEDSDGLIDYPRSVQGVEVAFMIKEVADKKYKINFRSRGNIDVNKFSAIFGGGGHKVASGCTMSGELNEVKDRIISELKKLIK